MTGHVVTHLVSREKNSGSKLVVGHVFILLGRFDRYLYQLLETNITNNRSPLQDAKNLNMGWLYSFSTISDI